MALFRVATFRFFALICRYFVISRGVISFFRYFAWRLFVFSSFRVALFRSEITKKRNGTYQPPYSGTLLAPLTQQIGALLKGEHENDIEGKGRKVQGDPGTRP